MSSTILKPWCIAAVATCTLDDPISINSTAVCQSEIPPIPEIGTLIRGCLAHSPTILSAIGLTAGPQYPPCDPFPPTCGIVFHLSRSTTAQLLIVLIMLIASAPQSAAASAVVVISVIFGVNFTITGVFAASLTQYVCFSTNSGTWPEAEPIPLSAIPCGHPKLSSNPSTPTSSTRLTISCHFSCSGS